MGLPRRWRLGSTERIREVLARGRRAAGVLGVLQTLPGPGPHWRAALVFSRRVGGSVVRHRARRRVQAALAGLEPRLPGAYDLVLRGDRACATLPYPQLCAELERLLVRCVGPLAAGPRAEGVPCA